MSSEGRMMPKWAQTGATTDSKSISSKRLSGFMIRLLKEARDCSRARVARILKM
jgi:hypothetical protein